MSGARRPDIDALLTIVVELMPGLPPKPPSANAWMRWFQLAFDGSQASMPMPADVDGAPAGPALPGPTINLTRQTSFTATGGVGVAGVPDSASESPFLNDFTSVTVVFASGLNAVFSVSSQTSGVAAGAPPTGLPAPPSSLPPQAARSAVATAATADPVRGPRCEFVAVSFMSSPLNLGTQRQSATETTPAGRVEQAAPAASRAVRLCWPTRRPARSWRDV